MAPGISTLTYLLTYLLMTIDGILVVVNLFSRILLIILLQFNSSDELRLKLINTGSDTLVYAAEETPLGTHYTSHSFDHTHWHESENLLGRALMSVRDKLVCIYRVGQKK